MLLSMIFLLFLQIDPEIYLQLYSNEYFVQSDSIILQIEYEKEEYIGRKHVTIFAKGYIIRDEVYRFILPNSEFIHVPIHQTYGFKCKKVKYIPVKEDR